MSLPDEFGTDAACVQAENNVIAFTYITIFCVMPVSGEIGGGTKLGGFGVPLGRATLTAQGWNATGGEGKQKHQGDEAGTGRKGNPGHN